MCAIVDSDVRDQVFGNNRTTAGVFFYDWLEDGGGRLVVGGKLLSELIFRSRSFSKWLYEARRSGRARIISNEEVNAETQSLKMQGIHKSTDPHVLALARVSGTRLLFTNDRLLQRDFRNPALISNPRGEVYTTRVHEHVTNVHRDRLDPRNIRQLCRRCN